MEFTVNDSKNGFHTVRLKSFEDFSHLLSKNGFREYPEYIFRGERDPAYELLPSLYREFNKTLAIDNLDRSKAEIIENKIKAGIRTANHLKHFLFGLRGTAWHESCHELLIDWFQNNSSAPVHINSLRIAAEKSASLWGALVNTWALGQHHKLLTPLLDWTESPLVAFYFAFRESDERKIGEESRVVYALNRRLIRERKNKSFKYFPLDFITPFARNNPRLIAQQGLFTFSHVYQSVGNWVAEEFNEEDGPVLIRFLIGNGDSVEALRWLNRHGINDRVLFPDLKGISEFTNRCLRDSKLTFI